MGNMRSAAFLSWAALLGVCHGARDPEQTSQPGLAGPWGAHGQQKVTARDIEQVLLPCKHAVRVHGQADACPLPHISTDRPLHSLAAPASPPTPTHAFMISTPQAHASGRLQYALDQVRAAGIPEPRVVYGFSVEDVEVRCSVTESAVGCRLGLTLTNALIWRTITEENIKAAWIFEDDVLFHDDFHELWPSYWSQVPPDYELVYASAWSQSAHQAYWETGVYHTPDTLVGLDEKVWAAGAYIISRTGAQRAYTTLSSMLWSHMHGNAVLSGSTSTADDLLANVLRPTALRPGTWAVFHNTRAIPGKFRGVHITPTLSVERYVLGVEQCACEGIEASSSSVPGTAETGAQQGLPLSLGLPAQLRTHRLQRPHILPPSVHGHEEV